MSHHPELHELLGRLRSIHEAVSNFQPSSARPLILDSSLEADEGEEGQWSQTDYIPGLRKLKEALKLDLDGLEKFLEDPGSASLPPLSTNAPYLISVWNELICAPLPVVAVFKTFLFEPSARLAESSTSSSPAAAQRKKNGVRPPGAKVDIVADGGRTWIRINTIKNSRLLAEFREIDSYLTDSSSDSEWDESQRPTLAQTQFDNSILKMGRALLQSARANAVEGMNELPRVVLRLTRLDPSIMEGPQADSRIGKTVEMLREMGIKVQLGERDEEELVVPLTQTVDNTSSLEPPLLIPSRRINLDLSVLIATISDLTHAPLPTSVEEANKRFIPPKEYREWKQTRKQTTKSADQADDLQKKEELSIDDLPHDLATHSRALTNQLLHEMNRSLIQDLRDRIDARQMAVVVGGSGDTTEPPAEFWVTTEARDRCLRIVSKIGATNEKRRAFALFCRNPSDPTQTIPLAEAEELFWQNSRFDKGALPLFPLHFHSSAAVPAGGVGGPSVLDQRAARHPFFKALAGTCQHILDQETMPHPNSLKSDSTRFISEPTPFPSGLGGSSSSSVLGEAEIQRAVVTKANPRLTAHTVESMLWGAELGWTTLTANRTSVKAILKEVKIARIIGKLDSHDSGQDDNEGPGLGSAIRTQEAAIWIIDPRSLAEQMASQT